MRDIAFSRTSYRRFAWLEGREDFGFGRDAQARGGTILFHKLLSQKNGRKISECSRPYLLKELKMSRYALTADSRRVSVDGRKRYENGNVDADQLMRFR